MASIAALIGAQVVGGIGQGIASGLQEQNRRREFDRTFGLHQDQFNFQKDYLSRQLDQNYGLQYRGQNLNFTGNILGHGLSAGGSLIGSFLNYQTSQNNLNYARELNTQRRSDLTNEGVPLSYLHLGGGMSRSLPQLPMQRTQTFGRNVSSPWGFANSGPNLRETYGAPPSYQQATSSNSPTTERPGFDPVSGYPKG